MKKQLTSLALSVILTTATFGTALADTNFDTLRNKPMGAIEAGDALGLEVIPRSELEEVRGEGWVKVAIKVIDWAGRAEIVGKATIWVWGNLKPSTCVYYGSYHANSTPSYCY